MSSHYVVSTYITRIKQVNPIVNAVTDERFKAALMDAKAADDFIAKTKISEAILVKNKPFLGVPITIKESCGVKGLKSIMIHFWILLKSLIMIIILSRYELLRWIIETKRIKVCSRWR